MGRGLFSGVLWGSLLSVLSLWLLSQISETVGFRSEPPQDVTSIAPSGSDSSGSLDVAKAPTAPDNQGSPATDPSRQSGELEQSVAEDAPAIAPPPADVPVVDNVVAEQSLPEPGETPVVIEPAESQTQTALATDAPVLPDTETASVQATEAPAPDALSTPESAPATPQIPELAAQSLPSGGNSPTAQGGPAQPAKPVIETVPESDFSTPQIVETPAIVEPAPEVEQPQEDADTPVEPEADPDTTVDTDPVVVDRTSREPTEDEASGEDVAQIGDGSETATPADPESSDGPAIQRYAQEFENPDGRPLMSIVLLIDGDAPDAATPGQPLPFPVSYAVDASKDNAGAVMAAYRANGHEIAVLTPLPEGAAPKDVEVAFQTYLAAVPEAVAVMDVPDAVFQSGRAVATQVAEALAASGLGMITYSRGLNSATQVAEREGVPAALVFRVFDDNGRDGAAIKRFLDQAAFRAGQQTGVILVGQNRPETVTALLEWGLGNRAGTVALAPVSVALTSGQ